MTWCWFNYLFKRTHYPPAALLGAAGGGGQAAKFSLPIWRFLRFRLPGGGPFLAFFSTTRMCHPHKDGLAISPLLTGEAMTVLEAYLERRRRATIRMWTGYALANGFCIGAMVLLLYI